MRVLIHHGKHGDDIYNADTDADLHDTALRLLKELYDNGWYYDDAENEAEQILNAGDSGKAYFFLRKRSDEGYEYERISLQEAR